MRKWAQAFILVAAFCAQALIPTAAADDAQRIVGTWQRVSSKDPQGRALQPPAPASILIFTADGHFAQIGFPEGRDSSDKPVNTFTREQLLERFARVEASHGTYKVRRNVLERENEGNINPAQEDQDINQVFRIEGDLLVLVMEPPAGRYEARFKRVK